MAVTCARHPGHEQVPRPLVRIRALLLRARLPELLTETEDGLALLRAASRQLRESAGVAHLLKLVRPRACFQNFSLPFETL